MPGGFGRVPVRISAALRGTGKGGVQRQVDNECSKRAAVVVDDCAEQVHAGVMRKVTLRAFDEFGSPSTGFCCSSAEFADLNVLNIAASEHLLKSDEGTIEVC